MIAELTISRGERVIRIPGTGPEESLCLLMVKHDGKGVGLGDHIQSLPVISELIARGYKLTVFASEFFRSLYESNGCTFFNETGIYFGMCNDDSFLSRYGSVYSMIEWSFDEHLATHGSSMLDHTSLFASFFGIERPARFDYVLALGAKHDPQLQEISNLIYAPQSSFAWRNLPRDEQIYHLLKNEYSPVFWIGIPQLRNRHNVKDFETLVDLIYNAHAVLTVDNGIMHFACALGVPMFGVFGGTDEAVLCEPYDFYLPEMKANRRYFRALPKAHTECNMPCWWQAERGFKVKGKCKESADCMTDIDKSQLLFFFNEFFSTIRSN